MSIWESVSVALENIRAHKMRAFLTIIGIFIRVAAVITVVSIGQAGKTSIVSDLAKYGDNVFVVYPNPGEGVQAEIFLDDLRLVRNLPGVRAATGYGSVGSTSRHGKDTVRFNVTGTTSEAAKTENMTILAGHFFTAAEERSGQKVVVVESDYADRFYGSPSRALRQRVEIGGKMYQIVGVFKSAKALFSAGEKEMFAAYIPLVSMPLPPTETAVKLQSLMIMADSSDPEAMKKTMDDVKRTLAKRHRVEASRYLTQSVQDVQEQVNSVFNILQTIIGSIAGISLLVGGVGVMNIMLVSVTEHTREIGIRKAIGATPGAIMTMFLIEAIVLCMIGGILGMGLGMLAAYIFSVVTGWPFSVSWWPIALAFGFSAAVGIFFGLYPANKAARMQPIESLRYE